MVRERPNQFCSQPDLRCHSSGFVYIIILDAFSRKVADFVISRSMDARVTVAALKSAIRIRQPSKGCIYYSDRGSNMPRRPIVRCLPSVA